MSRLLAARHHITGYRKLLLLFHLHCSNSKKMEQTLRLLHFLLSVLCLVALSPCPHGIQNGIQTFSELGQTVLHPGRNLGIHFPADQSLFLHIPELCGQHFLGHAADGLFQLPEPLGPRHQVPQDQDFPLIADEHQRGLHRAGRQFFRLLHGITPFNSFLLVTTVQ